MRTPRTLLALSVAFTAAAFAQPATPDKPAQPQTPATPAQAAPASQPLTSPGITVPDGKAVKTSELEGMLIEDLKLGDGYEIKPGGAVVINYHGWLKDGGKVIDSTYDPAFNHNHPVGYPLQQMIEGWQKGVPGMKLGGIRRLTIPAKLAYGERGSPTVPPNSDLIFVIEALDTVQVEDLKVGTGEELVTPFFAETNYTIKDKDGKVIEQSEPGHPFIWIPNEYGGLQLGLEGMKVGGKRKISIPKEFNRSNPQLAPANRAQDVPVTVEVEVLNARVIRPKAPPAPSGK
jgi:FKBP-type peptidyl-prolyl cis-trans isomerase